MLRSTCHSLGEDDFSKCHLLFIGDLAGCLSQGKDVNLWLDNVTSYLSVLLAVLDTNDRFLRKITIGQSATEKGFSRTVIVPFSHVLKSALKKVFQEEV